MKYFMKSVVYGWMALLVVAIAVLIFAPASVSTTGDAPTSEFISTNATSDSTSVNTMSTDDLLGGLRAVGAKYDFDIGEVDELGSLAYAVSVVNEKKENLNASEILLSQAAFIEFDAALLKNGEFTTFGGEEEFLQDCKEELLQDCKNWMHCFQNAWHRDFNMHEDAAWADWHANHRQWTAEQHQQWQLDHDKRWAEFSAAYDKMASVGHIMLELEHSSTSSNASSNTETV